MRLFAEEQKMGTLESLLTAPVRAVHVLLAKYFSAVIFYIILWIPNLFYLAILNWVADGRVDVPTGALTGSYIIILLSGLFHIAIGCLASALTRNQIVAAIICFTLILLHFLLGMFLLLMADNYPVQMTDFVNYFATTQHMSYFTRGLIDTRAIVYYVSFSVMLLTVTHQVLEYRRWKS